MRLYSWQRGKRNRPGIIRSVPLVLLFLLLAVAEIASGQSPQVVPVVDGQAEVELGARSRGDHFRHILHLALGSGSDRKILAPQESESTCDCVTTSIDSLDLVIEFEVEPEEPDGTVEKVVYVFTDDPAANLVRLVLRIEVLPGGGVESPVVSGQDTPASDSLEGLSEDDSRDSALIVLYFHSPGCQSCRRVEDYTLPYLDKRWGERIAVRRFNIDRPDGFGQLLTIRDHYRVDETRSPFLFAVGNETLTGEHDLAARLDRAIEQALATGQQTFIPAVQQPQEAEERLRDVFRSLSFWTVIGAGLLDGLNPCAFATLVFFVGLLGYTGSSKRQILIVGIGFTSAVFLVYLLLGLGAFRALQALAMYGVVARVVYLLTLLLLAILFLLSLRDLIQYWRTGETRDQVLQLSTGTKRRIHGVMRKGLKTGNLLLGAIGIGALVSLFEAACTGQVYLPTIVLMLKDPLLQGNAFLYLILYNLLFILPLVVVFVLSYVGVSSSTFAGWSKQHYGLTRLLMTLLFLALGLLMAVELPGL